MSIPSLPKTWSAGEILTHSALNTNFSTIRDYVNAHALWLDVASQTVSETVTFSAAQTFQAGISLTGSLTMATAASKIVPGATSFAIRNNADAANNLVITDAGEATIRAGLTITAGGLTVTAGGITITAGGLTLGSLTLSDATAKIIGGATATVFKNAGDSRSYISYANDSVLSIGISDGGETQIGEYASSTIRIGRGASSVVTIGSAANLVNVSIGGAIATNATAGHLFIPTCAGTPTGAVSNGALIIDTTNHKLYFRSTSWRDAGP